MSTTPQTADFDVKIEGKSLDKGAVVGITVRRDVSAPGVFELRLNNRKITGRGGTTLLSEDGRLSPGNAVAIEMGYVGQLKSVMTGEITGLELEFRSGAEMLTVRGHDRGHRLLRGRKTRSFIQVKDSDIASQVAQEAGLSAKSKNTQVTLDYVLQQNQTDWEFLQQRARNLGFEVLVDNQTLMFQPHQNSGREVLTLTREAQGLLEFRPRLSTVGLVGEVVVQGWSPKDQEAITGKASAGAEGTAMGSQGGLAAAQAAFDKTKPAKDVVVDQPVLTQAEADQIARGRLEEMALAYVTGAGVAVGNADLKAGTVVKITGFGKPFSGPYYLASICHTLFPKRSYRTAFTVRRNAT